MFFVRDPRLAPVAVALRGSLDSLGQLEPWRKFLQILAQQRHPFRFGTQSQQPLLEIEIQWKRAGDLETVTAAAGRAGQPGSGRQKGLDALEQLLQPASRGLGRGRPRVVCKEMHAGLQIGLLLVEKENFEAPPAGRNDIQPPIGVFPHHSFNRGSASNVDQSVLFEQHNSEFRLLFEGFPDHQLVSALEDMQGQSRLGKQHHFQREQRKQQVRDHATLWLPAGLRATWGRARSVDLRQKVVLITGASMGIGEACAYAFARRGARLILTARSAGSLERVRQAAAPADAAALAADLSQPDQAQALVPRALGCYGRIDVLVNNAGVGLYTPFWEADRNAIRLLMEVNFFAPLELIRGVLPHMRRQGVGTIVNVSSVAGKIPLPWLTLYSASKAALNYISDGLRMELHGTSINVVSVCPGYVSTGFPQHVLGGAIPETVARRKRFTITAEQCAEAIVKGVERGKRTVVTPASGWLLIGISRLLPGPAHALLAHMRRPAQTVDQVNEESGSRSQR
jgi:dehydrogenase/reductase SDR family protein 7B